MRFCATRRLQSNASAIQILMILALSRGIAQETSTSASPTHIVLRELVPQQPIHFTDDASNSSVRILFNLCGNHPQEINTSSGDNGPEYMHWIHEVVSLGLSADIPVGSSFALSLGGNYGSVEGEGQFGVSIGIGWCVRLHPIAFRIDLCGQIQSSRYDVDYVTTTYVSVGIFGFMVEQKSGQQTGSSSIFVPQASLTLNTTWTEPFCNPFVVMSYAAPKLVSFSTPEGVPVTEHGKAASMATGLSFETSSGVRFMPGVRFLWLVSPGENAGVTLTAVMQVDITL